MRKSNGQFAKGHRANPETEFKPGQHWREPKPHWDRQWMVDHYVTKEMSAGDIAKIAGCTENNVYYWLVKHGIDRRDVSQARQVKYWGASGKDNPMHGKTGDQNPRYVDGSSPERQRMYAQGKGRAFLREVLKRDGYKCVRCGAEKQGRKSLHVHHVKPWAGNPELRFDLGNVVTLCRQCHAYVHSNENKSREFLHV